MSENSTSMKLPNLSSSDLEDSTKLDDGTVVNYYRNGYEVYTYQNGTIITVCPDGSRVQKNAEGGVLTTDPAGVTRCVYPDGTKLTRMPDGSQETLCVDGTRIEEPVGGNVRKKAYKSDGSVIITHRDGRKVGRFADGCVVEEHDGVKSTRKPNGTVIVDFLDAISAKIEEGGESDKVVVKECTFSDGTVVYTYKSGRTYQIDADGYKTEVLTDGVKKQENPNGTIISSYPDGRKVSFTPQQGVTVTQYPDGRREQLHRDGTRMLIAKNGNAVAHRPDGTVIETFESGPVLQRDKLPDGRVITVMRDGTTKKTQSSASDEGGAGVKEAEEENDDDNEGGVGAIVESLQSKAPGAVATRGDKGDAGKAGCDDLPTAEKEMSDLTVSSSIKDGITPSIISDNGPGIVVKEAPSTSKVRTTRASSATKKVPPKLPTSKSTSYVPCKLSCTGELDASTLKRLQYFLNSRWVEGAAIISRGKAQSKRLAYTASLDNRTVRSLQCFLNSRKEDAKLTLGLLKTQGRFDAETRAALLRFLNSNWKLAGLKRSKLRGHELQTKGIKALQTYLNSTLSTE